MRSAHWASAFALLLMGSASAQVPGSVNYSPPPPPEAAWPLLADEAATLGAPGTNLADPEVGRGVAWADVVGPDPAAPGDPTRVGPPDGLLDLVLANSNSPVLPLGAQPGQQVTPAIGSSPGPSAVFRAEPDGSLTRVTAYMGSTGQGFDLEYPGGSPWGVVAADYDGDGDNDLFYPCGGFNTTSPNALMRNDGDGTFTYRSLEAGVRAIQVSFGACWFDYDRDGDLDLHVVNSIGAAPKYYQGAPNPDPVDRLYRNEGDGTFTQAAGQAGVNLRSAGFSTMSGDLDLDGWPDLVVSCFRQYNKLFYNKGDGTFSFMAPAGHPRIQLTLEESLAPDPSSPGALEFAFVPATWVTSSVPTSGHRSLPVELTDVNGDGWIDVAYGVWSFQTPDPNPGGAAGAVFTGAERQYLYLNLGDQDGDGVGDGDYREVGLETGFSHFGGTMGLVASDLNADGFPDLYVGNGGPFVNYQLEEDLLYVNEGSRWPRDFLLRPKQPLQQVFWEVGALSGCYSNVFMAHGLMTTPARPGRGPEVLVSNGGPALFNVGQTNAHYTNLGRSDGRPIRTFGFDLEPTASPPGAIGTRVELLRGRPGEEVRLGVLEARSGSGFASSTVDGPLVFGLDTADPVYANIRWTSGVYQGRFLLPLAGKETAVQVRESSLSTRVESVDETLLVTLENRRSSGMPVTGDLYLTLARPLESASPVSIPRPAPARTHEARHSKRPTVSLGSGSQGGVAAAKNGAGGLRGWTLGTPRLLVRDVTLNPFEPWRHEHALPPGAAPALYRFLLVDPATSAVLSEGGLWFERGAPLAGSRHVPPMAPGRQPGQWLGSMRASGTRPAAERPTLDVRTGLELSAAHVRVISFDGRPTTSLDLERPGALELRDGSRLSWSDGRLRARPPAGASLALHFEDDALVMTTGVPDACCDAAETALPTVLRFERPTGTLRVDGVELTARGAPTGR